MNIRHTFYVQPMYQVYWETVIMYVVWTALMFLPRGRGRRVVGAVFSALAVGLIVFYTLVRSEIEPVLNLKPFISFQNAKTDPEFYRTMYFNMLLFMPLGLSLPFALPARLRHPCLLTAAAAAALSVGIEAAQYVFRLGRCETDDVLMNVLGALIGVTSFLIHAAVHRAVEKHHSKNRRRE